MKVNRHNPLCTLLYMYGTASEWSVIIKAKMKTLTVQQ